MSGRIASRFIAVSASVSPFTTLDVAIAMFSVSALSRFSAISNEVRVRVLGSKKRLTTVLPRKRRHLLDGARGDLFHRVGGVEHQRDLVGQQIRDAEQILRPQRGHRRLLIHVVNRRAHTVASCCNTTSSCPSVSWSRTRTLSSGVRRQVLPDVVRLDGQLAVPAIDEHDQLNRLRPPEIDQRVERRPRRPARVEHVVHEQDLLVVDRERDLGAADERLRADGVPHQVVAIERDVERAGGNVVSA